MLFRDAQMKKRFCCCPFDLETYSFGRPSGCPDWKQPCVKKKRVCVGGGLRHEIRSRKSSLSDTLMCLKPWQPWLDTKALFCQTQQFLILRDRILSTVLSTDERTLPEYVALCWGKSWTFLAEPSASSPVSTGLIQMKCERGLGLYHVTKI